MIKLGKYDDVVLDESCLNKVELKINSLNKDHIKMPDLPSDKHILIAGIQRLGEELYVCQTESDIMEIYNAVHKGMATSPIIHWYTTDDIGHITAIKGNKQS